MNIQGWFPLNWLVWTPWSPRDSQESYLASQFKSINSSKLSLLHGSTLTSIHDYWKNHEWVSEVAQLCPTLWDPMDCSPPGSSVHGIFQAGILERVSISFSRGSSRPRDQTRVSSTAGRRFTIWATREAHTTQDIQVQSLGREDSLAKEMATHSSTLSWKIPWTEEPGMLQCMGSQRVGHDWATSLTLFSPVLSKYKSTFILYRFHLFYKIHVSGVLQYVVFLSGFFCLV